MILPTLSAAVATDESRMARSSFEIKAGRNEPPVVRGDAASREFLQLIPRDFARQHLILSQGRFDRDGNVDERAAIADRTSQAAVFNIGVRLGVQVESFIADGESIARAIDDAYAGVEHKDSDNDFSGDVVSIETSDVDRLLAEADSDLLSVQGKAPVIKLIDAMLFEALGRSASDVHVQPLADRTLVRYRLDGVLHTVREIPSHLTAAVISRIKVMGRMDIAERRAPQDGRASVTIGDRSIDLRISTLPTSHGERAVIRLLDNSQHLCDFAQLGMPPDVATSFLDCASRANGMILLTGPTGSGKTTTLYSTLRHVSAASGGGLNVMTIEDPIEYELTDATGIGSISQSQVNLKKRVTFATGLRHILRQDPDVIMIGEIRDGETARIAVQSSLTGHLVFSTLHTNDAASAVTRLIDLEVEPYLVAASLSAALAQRLVRVFHTECKGTGCEGCLKTGFRGRIGLFELLAVDDRIRDLISGGAALSEIRRAAQSSGMTTLKEDGERLVASGRTSSVEVLRVVQGAQ